MAVENHIPFLELSSALSDVAASRGDDGSRRVLHCEPFPAGANAQVCVAAWHGVLHWLRYSDEPVITCLLNVREHKAWPLITETGMQTSLGELLDNLRGQWMEDDSGWLELDDSAHPGLTDQLRCHAIRLADDRGVGGLRAEFEIVATELGWETDCAASRFTPTYQRRVMHLWRQTIVRMLENPGALLSAETHGGGGVTGPVVPIAGNLVARFAEWVAQQPVRVAVVDRGKSYTFGELDTISSSWAQALRTADVRAGQCVGVAFERNWKMVAAQYAVLKLGAVFVPLDVGQPQGRLQAIVEDTGMSAALTEDACIVGLAAAIPGVKCISADELAMSPDSLEIFSGEGISADDLAYVVFTSGSTGRPKGVKVSHANLLNFVVHFGRYIGSSDVVTQFAPFAFDASVAEIHICTLNGAKLVMLSAELIENPEELQRYMTGQGVTFAAFPPQYARHLSPSRLPTLKTLLTAGSAPDHELIRRWQPHLNYVNGYGPTETTVLSTAWHASRVPQSHEPIVIGSPIANTEVRVVNRFNRSLPRGVVGELLIGGAGVAHGYLKRQDLTRERFTESDRTRWYRSGDLSCFNEEDELIFAGRVDKQVKLRGHRLEPGEVEAALLCIHGIRQAAVLTVDFEAASQLVAFCVGERQEEESLRERMRQLTPAWAVPNRFLWVDSIPLTRHGKTNYAQLERDWQRFEEPRRAQDHVDELEAQVAQIWGSVLQRSSVSREDNFIHLGGDSLTALVVMSALKRLGYTITSSQLLTHPRLADFAALLKATGRSGQRDYAPCEGFGPPSPIQGWFFDLDLERPDPFCQTLTFESEERLDVGRLQGALTKLTRHHDQLRARFVRDGAEPVTQVGWLQEVLPESLALPAITHLEVSDAQLDATSERYRLSLADELRIGQAPLFRMALLTTPTRSRVLWVLHHLIVDTVSHGILLEDLRHLYEHGSDPIEQVLPGKSISYLSWSDRLLADCTDQPSLHQWLPILQKITQAEALPIAPGPGSGQPLAILETRLSRADSGRLIESAAACYHQSPEEIVLAATYLALARTFKAHRLAIDVEWHGRDEELAGDQGLDRTIGWFTSVHPLYMEVPATVELGSWLIGLKETRARIPGRGRNFYALRYLSQAPEVRTAFAGYRSPQVLFNFSGVVQRQQGSWRTVPTVAIEMGEGNASPYALSVETEIRDGELIVSFYHDPAAWPQGSVAVLSGAMTECLKDLIAHCCEPGNERWTPSDFPLTLLTQREIDELPRSVKNVYPLTDMQQTMFRHKETYAVFMCYRIPRRLQESQWRAAIADWIRRHDCLRTYIKEWSNGRVDQVVLETIEAPLSVHRTEAGNGAQLARELMERARRFPVELAQAPLFDILTVDDDGQEFRCVLAVHHIIHDGWSVELLLADLLQTYLYYCGETSRRPTAPLASVADIVAEQNRLRASPQWRAYWADLPWQSDTCQLPEAARVQALRDARQSDTRLLLSELDEKLVRKVRAKAHSLGVTVNSLWLTGYACLLRFLGGRQQVRCGVIQSGRLEQIPGVETITGCCVNTLPLVLSIEPTQTLSKALADVSRQLEKMRAGAQFPLSDIHNMVRPRIEAELFSTLFNIESHLYGTRREEVRGTLESGYESTNSSFIFGLIERAEGGYGVRIGYDANRYDVASVERWLGIYQSCVQLLIERADVPWNRLQILPEELRRKIVSEWNATERPYPHDRCVAELFREQAARLPEHPALLYRDRQVSYRELDARTDELARLLQAKGVKPETVVGLVAERSLEGVIAILAIFKAGGAYVPLDPKYPPSRIRHMVRDVGCTLAILQRRGLSGVIPPDLAIEPIYLDEPIQPAGLPASVSTVGHHSRQLAYVMYTSGSTGNPKGVMIEQRSIVRLVKGTTDIAFAPEDRILLTSAPGFDVTTFEIWSALLNGLTLAIVDEDTLLDPERLAAEIRDKRIATLWLIAPLFNRLVQEKPDMFAGVKQLMLGGDALSPPHVRIARQANPGLQVINGYGPTENTSFSTYHFLSDADSDCIPIGRPLTNSTAYVFNKDGQLLPPGVSGELVVGGPGVARGYLNQAELTAEKFISDPFSSEPEAYLYRTGDLVRWRDDGLIDFLGRIDHQVKIRGFRVELGEIEYAIASHEDVKQALVLISKEDNREHLIAYVVPRHASANHQAVKDSLASSIVSSLKAGLPDYMVPTAFVFLEAMPRNANGKIDRGRLPEPDASAYLHDTFVEPATDSERALWTIWKEVLGADSFGVTDDFFAIGGDSILAIQVVARASKQHMTLTTRQIIEEKTIRNLARHFVGAKQTIAEPNSTVRANRIPAAVSGEQRLLPIQLQFLQDDRVDLHHYNQYAWIDLPPGISREKLQAALSAIIARHDVLRLKFRETSSGWVAQYMPQAPQDLIVEEDLSSTAAGVARAQASLDVRRGRLCTWLWVKGGQQSRLLWVMHHLIVDGVSWRVLVADLATALAGRELEPKSSSYQEWAASLHEYAFSPELDCEKAYWLRQLASPVARLKSGPEGEAPLEESTRYIEVGLGADDTSRLLHKANRYYGTQTRHLLIAALTRTLGEWLESDDIRIDLEGHGREEREGLDLSQTVGWFTTLFPVYFGEARADLGRHIRRTRESLDAVPGNGLGYGILNQLARDEELHDAREKLHFSESDVLFNYLGQFDASVSGGSSVSPRRRRTHALRINAAVNAGVLSVRFDYGRSQLEEQTVATLAEQYVRTLSQIVEHCTGGTTEDMPVAFPLAGLSAAELGALQSRYGSIRDIYPCTGMQQGLLLYTGRDPDSGAYLTQLRMDLENLEPARLRRSWQELIKRHAILRTAFVDANQSYLLQLVLADASLPWRELDARAFASSKELEDLLSQERIRPFDMSAAPLMRVLLVRIDEQRYRLAWTHHHALLDGWSMGLVIRELFDIYAALGRGACDALAPDGPSYKDYVEWLQNRDREAAARYWRSYLQGADVTPHACLPVRAEGDRDSGQKAHTVALAADATALLVQLARSSGVSLSTLILGAWGLLLSKYGSTDEVLFGYASSGRPAALPGVESMVGLFINSLPLRLKIDGDRKLGSWLTDIQRRQLDHEEHGFLEAAEIQRLGGLRPDQNLFDSLVVVENYPLDRSICAAAGADGLRMTDPHGVEQNGFALNLVVYPGERLTLKLAYQTLLFDEETIALLARRLECLLISLAQGGGQKIAQLSVLTSEEQTRAIRVWNDTRSDYPHDCCVHEILALRASAHPRNIAIVSKEGRWTYRKLWNRVRAISAWLSSRGVAPGDKVALSLRKEPDLIASMIAIMHAGAAYVPVALDCPSERRAFIAADAGIKWTLTRTEFASEVETPDVATLTLEQVPGRARALKSQATGSQETAYIIYTSGTTGKPKGVATSHRNVINFCSWFAHSVLDADGAVTQFAPYTFDASAGEIFGALLAGHELHLLTEETIQDPRAMESYLVEHEIGFAAFPPPYLQQLDPDRVPKGMTILTAGSASAVDLVERWAARCRYINGYGPTETTVISTAWEYDPAEFKGTLSIGGPISNTSIYVVDSLGQLCAPGLIGEILIGGDGVAQGYVNRAQLTEQQFIADPWSAGGRLYRTGDLGRWLPDGRIEFVGRRDRQVKVRGYRIELGEIESRLREHPEVKDAAVALRGTDTDVQILAWVVFRKEKAESYGHDARIESLYSFLRQSLPSYMLPQAIVPLDQLPLTAHGKVDEKVLPAPDQTALPNESHVAPRTEIEKRVTEICAAVLKRRPEQISITADFFELGGQSLLAMRVIARLREELGVEVPVAALFARPMLADLANAVEKAKSSTLPPIIAEQRDALLPLSFAQQRLWFMAQIDGASEAYHIPGAISLTGPLNRAGLRRALDRIVARHEALRATFYVVDGEPVQRIAPPETGFALSEHDLRRAPDAPDVLRAMMDEEARAPFDFEKGPLVRGRLIALGEHEHVLLLTMHHIVTDGWSMGVMIRELSTLYGAYCADRPDPMPPLAIQYGDYVLWQQRWFGGEVLREQYEYWQRTLAGAPPLLELPTDRPRPAQQQFAGDSVNVHFDEKLTAGLKALSQRHGTTLFTTLLAGWSVVLSRLSGQQDVVIGATVANRTRVEVEPLIGFFVNALALRLDLSGAPAISELLRRTKAQVLGMQDHQEVPFEKVVEIVAPPRNPAHSPIFQVSLNWQNMEIDSLELDGLQVALIPAPQVISRIDMIINLAEAGGCIAGFVEFATALFDRESIERHVGYLRRVLQAMVEDENGPVGSLPLMDDTQRRQLLTEFNATRVAYPQDKLVHELFAQQAARTPGEVAVVFEGQSLTYAELNTRANQLARYLRQKGVGPDQLVGIHVERSLEMVVGLLGIWKAGGAYVPLDPSYPAERLAYMLEDASPQVLLTQASLREEWTGMASEVIALDADWAEIGNQLQDDLGVAEIALSSRNLAYVIYTSGSTGRPKGVMIEHSGLLNYLQWALRTYATAEGEGSPVSSSLAFDATVTSLFTPLLSGRSVVLIRDGDEIEGLSSLLSQSKPWSLVKISPAHLNVLGQRWEQGTPCSVRAFVIGGEALSAATVELWQELAPEVRLINEYGPTETVVGCTTYELPPRARGMLQVPIGRPISNARIYILDASLQPVPIGVTGEIYIGGAGVARGYLNRPELTAERFLKDIHSADPGARMYRTGDLGRWRADGNIEYLGRNDHQVKIRGFRIELGEIEAQLVRHAQVKEAAVLARDDVAGDKRLVAYVVVREAQAAPDSQELRSHLSSALPEYMVPGAFVVLEKLPLTPNGKVDRRALPAPELGAYVKRQYEAPQGEVEEILAGIWQTLVGAERIGRHDNFFELGGHSLLIVEMLGELQRFGLSVEVGRVFESPTLAALASELTRQAVGQIEVPPNLIPAGCEVITPQMLPLVELDVEQIERIVQSVPGGARNIQDIYPLAPLQEGILFHHLLNEQGADPYLLRAVLSLSSRKKLEELISAFQKVIDRHDVLRAAVLWEQLPRPMQVVYRQASLTVEEITLGPQSDPVQELKERMKSERIRLDVRKAPLMQLQVCADRHDARCYALVLLHHLASDHESLDLMLEEVMVIIEGRALELPEPVAYRNHVAQALALGRRHDSEAFFRGKLAEIDEPTAPFGLLDVHGHGDQIERASQPLETQLGRRLRGQARRLGVSAATLFHAAWGLVVARSSGRDDVVYGTLLLGRMQGSAGTQRIMGMFINTLPLRLDLRDMTAKELVEQTQRELVQLLGHEQSSLAVAQRCSGIVGSAPLFSTVLNYRHSAPELEETWASAAGVEILTIQEGTNYPIAVSIDDLEDGFSLTAQTDRRIEPNRILAYTTAAVRSLVEALEEAPQRRALSLSILPESERHQVLELYNATQTAYPAGPIHGLFEEQVRRTPDAVAVVYEGQSLTYAELNARANQLAWYLRDNGVGPDELVGICVERGLEMMVGLLGTLKAGGAYVPLDPTYPTERLAYMLEDAAPKVLLTQARLRERVAGTKAEVVVLDREWEEIARNVEENPRLDARRSHHLAYVIYTSGSTGKPKGVMIEHGSLSNYLHWAKQTYRPEEGAGTVVASSLGFDATITSLYLPLLCGGAVTLVRDGQELEGLEASLREPRTWSLVKISPAHLAVLGQRWEKEWPCRVRAFVIGGEALPPATVELWQGLAPQTRLINEYGPTETVVGCSSYEVPPLSKGLRQISIGRPIGNARLYILDRHLQPVPMGATGEIYVGGAGVARGYLNRPELTAERFLQDPFAGQANARMYKTGDLARYLPDGTLEYLGRADFQVKVRGFRIELGEIESALMRHHGVREAIVVALDREQGDKQLVAYITQSSAVATDELRARLQGELPDYMIPGAIVTLDALPLNRNGKIDRRALPDPSLTAYQRGRFEAPHAGTEALIANIWSGLLKVEQVGRNDSFFDLGGNSILLIRMLSELRKHRMVLNLAAAHRLKTLAEYGTAVMASAQDPLLWLQSTGWMHKVLPVGHRGRAGRVLLLDQRGKAGQRDLQNLLAQADESKRPDFVRLCADVELLAQDVGARGLAALVNDAAPDDARIGVFSRELEAYHRRLMSTASTSEYPFSPIQQNMMPWTARDGFQCIAIHGWYSSQELQQAFSRLVSEQDLLRSTPDMAHALWKVLPEETASAAALPTIDLKMGEAAEFERLFKRIAAQMLAEKQRSALPYTAAWVSVSDMQHYLVLVIDHLIWDGASAAAFQRRLMQFLRGATRPMESRYHDYVEDTRRVPGPEAWQRLQARFDHRELSNIMANTLRALGAKAHLPLIGVRFKVPLDATADPATQIFGGFKRWVMSYTGLSRFAMVLTHHARQLGERTYFDQVGLFLDKLPFVVDPRTRLEDFSSGAAHLHGHGWTYLGLEYAAGPERAPVLPPIGHEIVFNYQAYGDSQHELQELVIDAARVRESLEGNYGVVFEAFADDGHLLAHCLFRGQRRDIESLFQCFPGCSLIETHGLEVFE